MRKVSKKQKSARWDQTFSYLRESRNYIYSIAALFIICALVAFITPSTFAFLEEALRQLINKTQDLSGAQLTAFIFFNNTKSAFLGLILGIVLGIFPLINAASNGLVLGYVFSKVHDISGISEFWKILPHGIFELPAIFISLGLGIRLGLFLFTPKPMATLKHRLFHSLRLFVVVVIPLLVVAAIIEGILITVLK